AHRDPFDRMLPAQSRIEGRPLVTADPVFKAFGTKVIWCLARHKTLRQPRVLGLARCLAERCAGARTQAIPSTQRKSIPSIAALQKGSPVLERSNRSALSRNCDRGDGDMRWHWIDSHNDYDRR